MIIASCIAILLLMCAPLHAQWVNVPPAKVPRTPDGNPNLSAPAPRLSDGKPDLSGVWKPVNTYEGKPANFAADLHAIGKWDGDTLVVDTKGFNGKIWLDLMGTPSTEALHVTERFHRRDFGHMDIDITIDDPKAHTGPWTVNEHVQLLPDTELMEAICNENNRDLQHLPGDDPR